MRYPSFTGGSYVSRSQIASNQRTINFYPETVEVKDGTTQLALYATPGVISLGSTSNGGPGRAHFAQNGREFAVIGTKFVEIDQSGIITTIGDVGDDGRPATICGNGAAGGQIFITSGKNGFLYTLATSVLSSIAALAGIAWIGEYLGGYFLSLNSATATVMISDLLDGSTWDPLQFFTRSGSSDGWIGMKANQYLYLLGTQSGEVWFNSGAFPIPFELHPSGRIQYGTGAEFSLEVVGTSLCWLGATANGRGNVLRTGGFSVEVISDYAVHFSIGGIGTISDAIGDSYEQDGHIYYILTFRTGNRPSWVYDASMSAWHERSTWDAATNNWDPWRPLFQVFTFGDHRCLDIASDSVWSLSKDSFVDCDGNSIRRYRRPPALVNENKNVFYRRIELLSEVGLGTTGQGANPQAIMRWTDDGGKTWGPEQFSSTGAMGEYDKRIYWSPCGSGRKREFDFTFSDPIDWNILDAYIDAQPGRY